MVHHAPNPVGAEALASDLAIRVYYEDTDFSGRVYHASYLRFLERGRTEWLRARGFEQRAMARENSFVFVVRRLTVDFIKAASMDDLISVQTRLARLGAASFDFRQTVLCNDACLLGAQVNVVSLKGGRPTRLPAEVRARLLG
jgi:acyl-CoA thioester hydrolase